MGLSRRRAKSHCGNFVQSCEFVCFLFFLISFFLYCLKGQRGLRHFVRDGVFRKRFLFLHVCRAQGEICSQYPTNESENCRDYCYFFWGLPMEKTPSSQLLKADFSCNSFCKKPLKGLTQKLDTRQRLMLIFNHLHSLSHGYQSISRLL